MPFDLKSALVTVAPTLAGMLGGPLALAAVASLEGAFGLGSGAGIDGITKIIQSGGMSPEVVANIRLADQKHAEVLGQQGVDLEKINLDFHAAQTQNAADINKTMQTETISEHWPSFSWRPYCGFVFGTMFFGCYFVLPLLRIPVPVVPVEAWAAMGSVLGIASWFRGKAQADPANPAETKG